MLNIETRPETQFKSLTIEVKTPEGSLFVSFVEDDNGKPIMIDVKLGKAGAAIQAWAMCLTRVMTLALDKGATIEDILEETSGQRADGGRPNGHKGSVVITSGPEAIAWAIMEYKRERFAETRKQLGLDDDTIERDGRSSRVAG